MNNDSVNRIIIESSLLVVIFILSIFIVIYDQKKRNRILSQKRIFAYQFRDKEIIVNITSTHTKETELIEYTHIKKVYEMKNYFLIIAYKKAFYVPKNDRYYSLYNKLKDHHIRCHKVGSVSSSVTIYKILAVLLPFLCFVSMMIIVVLVTEQNDLFLWFLLASIPILTIVYGVSSKKYLSKIASVITISLGSLFLFLDLIGLFVVFYS